MNILIVEDELAVAKIIKNIFSKVLYINIIDIVTSFNEWFDRSLSNTYDIILIDINLWKTGFNWIELCKIIKKNNASTPVVFITANHSLDLLERAFELWANDYITKPFKQRELYSRVKRWFFTWWINNNIFIDELRYFSIAYCFNKNEFYWDWKKIPLTKKSKVLFLIFLKKPEVLLTEEYIREKLWWDYNLLDKNRNLRSNIQALRKSLHNYCLDWIQTIRWEWYVLIKKS